MINTTRKRHRLIWIALAILLPLLFAASIMFRHEEPVNEKIPEKTTAKTQRRGESK